jgi:putative tryptophan/tyrosine transport system substrate-binding protein
MRQLCAQRLNRRAFVQGAGLAGLGLLAGCGQLPLQVPSTAATTVHRIGYLSVQSLALVASRIDALQRSLRELGWIDGQNLTIERRLADGQVERLPDLCVELLQLQPDVVVTSGDPAARAMKNATHTVPIVMGSNADPVGSQLVASFAHPGGNVTGVSEMAPELAGKRLELFKETVPTMARVGALFNAGDQAMAREYGETLVGAQAEGVEILNLSVRTPGDLDQAYQTAAAAQLDGVVVIVDALITQSRSHLVELSTRSGLPTISGDAGFAAAGGLMSYGPNFVGQMQRAAYYVDRILRGAKPADLPVEQPVLFDLIINLNTAQTIGLTIPQQVLLQATELIQ